MEHTLIVSPLVQVVLTLIYLPVQEALIPKTYPPPPSANASKLAFEPPSFPGDGLNKTSVVVVNIYQNAGGGPPVWVYILVPVLVTLAVSVLGYLIKYLRRSDCGGSSDISSEFPGMGLPEMEFLETELTGMAIVEMEKI